MAEKKIAVLFSGTGFAKVEYEELKGEVMAPPKPGGVEGEKAALRGYSLLPGSRCKPPEGQRV